MKILVYQNTVYNAARIPQIITDPIINPGVTLNIDLSISITCISFAGFGFAKLITIIIMTIAKKVIVILSRKG